MEELHTPKTPLLPNEGTDAAGAKTEGGNADGDVDADDESGPSGSSQSGVGFGGRWLAPLVALDVWASSLFHQWSPGVCIDVPLALFAMAFS